MLKKVFLIYSMSFMLLSSLTLLAQETTSTTSTEGSESVKPREELNKKFIEILAAKDEASLIKAIETGDNEVKALGFIALTQKGAQSELAITTINRYITYGLSSFNKSTTDVYVRNKASEAASIIKAENSVYPLSELIYLDNSTSNIIVAIYALGEIGSKKGTAALLSQIRLAKNSAIVNEAAIALGKIGDPDSLNDLINLAQNDRYSLNIRNAAIDAIANIKADTTSSTDSGTTATQ